MNVSGIECYEKDGTVYLKLEAVARGLGFTQTQNKNGTEYTSVRWERVEGYLADIGFPHKWGKDDFIPENIFCRHMEMIVWDSGHRVYVAGIRKEAT